MCGVILTALEEHSYKCNHEIANTNVFAQLKLLEMGKNPDPARKNRTSEPEPRFCQEPKRTRTRKFKKNVNVSEPNRNSTCKEPNRTRTQMSWFLPGSFTELNCRYIHTLHNNEDPRLLLFKWMS